MEETLALNDSAPSLHLADPRVVVNSVSHIINIYIYIYIFFFLCICYVFIIAFFTKYSHLKRSSACTGVD